MAGAVYFSSDYTQARQRFLEAAGKAGAKLHCYRHPDKGPEGEDLTTDVAWLGPEDAGRVLVTLSGTHGVEGFCGSGAQSGWFESGLRLAAPGDRGQHRPEP